MAANKNQKVAMVTGGNKGLGLALVRGLLKQFPGIVYLTSRDEARGQAAVQQLKGEGLSPAYHQLDIGDSASIKRFAEFIKKTYGGIDVVIANASLPPKPGDESYGTVSEMIRVNNKGNAELCTTLLPLLRPQARMLVVSSGFGQVTHLGPDLQKRFLATDKMTVNDLNALLDEYLSAVKDGSFKQKGWPDWVNKMSKIGLVALARILSRQAADDKSRPGILVNAVCPGWTVTDSSRPFLDENFKFGDAQAKQPDEAAVDVLWLATLPPGTTSPNGQLVQYRKVLSFEG